MLTCEILDFVSGEPTPAGPPGIPLIIQSNAGIPRMEGGRVVYDVDPGQMARHAGRLHELGIRYIGGCCGTGPDHIRAMIETIKNSDGK